MSPVSTTLSIPQLRTDLAGQVIAPGDGEYDQARSVFADGIDRHPAVVVRPANAGEVSRVVSLARDTGLELAVRSGGHSGAGHGTSDGGIVLDMSAMRAIEIDVENRTAWAETGLTAAEYTTVTGEHGLATGFGDAGSVGIGGITLAGGVGYLARKHGLTIDSLLAADVVTADGRLLHVDGESRPDLFWAIRGGGGNFGVATRFQYRLHEVSTVLGGMLMLPATPEIVAAFVAEAGAAANELSVIANVMPAPPMPFLPAEHHGKLVVMALLAYAGPADEGQRVVAPLRALGTPIVDMVRPMPYPQIYPPPEEGYRPIYSSRTMFVDSVDLRVAETIVDQLRAGAAPMRAVQLRVLGGAVARVPSDATAFAHRKSKIMVNVAAVVQNSGQLVEATSWVTGLAGMLEQNDSGAYVAFLGDEGEARIRAAYPGSTWDRLTQVKRRYDPGNLFRLNQNIPPASHV